MEGIITAVITAVGSIVVAVITTRRRGSGESAQ